MTGRASRDRLIHEVSVRHFDVIVVGGGIAGVAVAERLAREARRRNRSLRIALVEKAPFLGEGSSGRLEGWFHTGALYSALADGQTFMTCVKTVERLINWYKKDRLFLFRDNCNFDLAQDRGPRSSNRNRVPKATSSQQETSPWFLSDGPIYYALRQELEGSANLADQEQWKQHAERISTRIQTAYWEWEWLDAARGEAARGLAEAPPPADALKPPERSARAAEPEEDFLRTPTDGEAHQINHREIGDMLRRYEKKSESAIQALYKVYSSRDAVMDTLQILTDLARSAAFYGVEFITGTEIQDFNVPPYGEISVTGLVGYQAAPEGDGAAKRILHLLARQYVFALGSGFSDDFLRKELGLRLRVETHKSVMAVIEPPLVKHNFVRMDYYPKNHFNHILRSLDDASADGGVLRYSMIANSAFDTRDSAMRQIAHSIEGLLETACKYFPDNFYRDEDGTAGGSTGTNATRRSSSATTSERGTTATGASPRSARRRWISTWDIRP